MFPGLKSMCDGSVVRSTIAGLKRIGKRLYKGSIYGLKRSHRWRVYYWIFFGKCVDFSCFSLQIRCILNFVPLTLYAATWLEEMNTIVSFAIRLVQSDEREFVISPQENNSWTKANSCELVVKSLQCLPRKSQGFAPNTTVKPKRSPQILATAIWVRTILFSTRSEFKTAMFALGQDAVNAVLTADFMN